MAALAQTHYFRGDVERGLALWSQLGDEAATRGDQLQRAWGLNGKSEGLLKLAGDGAAETAIKLLSEALEQFRNNVDNVSQTGTYGLLGIAHLRRDDVDAAREVAAAGIDLAESYSSSSAYYSLVGLSAIARSWLTLCERGHTHHGELETAMRSCLALDRYARRFLIGRPVALICNGQLRHLRGDFAKANRNWRAAIELAEKLKMPFESGIAHYELGRHAPGSTERHTHLCAANEYFTNLGARHDASLVQSALES
jgi:tetratricopeptide (TPR) repeat protein